MTPNKALERTGGSVGVALGCWVLMVLSSSPVAQLSR